MRPAHEYREPSCVLSYDPTSESLINVSDRASEEDGQLKIKD